MSQTPYWLVRKKADAVRKKYGSSLPAYNPEQIAERMGVEVLYANFTDAKADMAGFYDVGNKKIYVAKDQPANRKTYTVAHELGHHVLHQEYAASENYHFFPRNNDYFSEKPREEKEADEFAATLLVPLDVLGSYRRYMDVDELSGLFAVSRDVIFNRLDRLENG